MKSVWVQTDPHIRLCVLTDERAMDVLVFGHQLVSCLDKLFQPCSGMNILYIFNGTVLNHLNSFGSYNFKDNDTIRVLTEDPTKKIKYTNWANWCTKGDPSSRMNVPELKSCNLKEFSRLNDIRFDVYELRNKSKAMQLAIPANQKKDDIPKMNEKTCIDVSSEKTCPNEDRLPELLFSVEEFTDDPSSS